MKYFGTDGIRGKAGSGLNNYTVAKLGQALAVFLRERTENENITVVTARDTRVSGKGFEDTLARALADFGISTINLGVVPTPVAAFYIRHFEADAGVVISASHNPPEYNGLKIFNSKGYKYTEREEDKIEALMDMTLKRPAGQKGTIGYPADIFSPYTDFIVDTVNPDLKDLSIYLDCSEGASFSIAPYIFSRLSSNVLVMAGSGDGSRINIDCGATVPEFLAACVRESGCDVGFSFDGDADRLIAVDRDGTIIDGDKLMYIHAVDFKNRGKLRRNAVVGTVMSNLGFANALKGKGIRLIREAVGDKYVFDRMITEGYNIGGEQSGHLIFTDYQTTGDGILSAVLTAALMARTGKSLTELAADIKPCPQIQLSVAADNAAKQRYEDDEDAARRILEIDNELGDGGRVLVRPSGTEPKIRIMVEASSEDEAKDCAQKIKEIVQNSIE